MDKTGKILFKNLKQIITELREDINDEEIQRMIDEEDRDRDGQINYDEFMRVVWKAKSIKHSCEIL